MEMERVPRDDVLATMPLHGISQEYGTDGLRARFDLETRRFEPEERAVLQDACELAMALHEGQERDGGQPYADHLLRVATRIMSPDHYDSDDIDLIVAALLHDSVENQAERLIALGGESVPADLEPKEAALWVIGQLFNDDVAGTVEAVTNPEFDRSGDWRAEYRGHVEEKLREHPAARVIKASDFTDNAVGIFYSPESRWPHFANKYAPLVPVFQKLIMLPDTPLSDKAKEHILDQLDSAAARFALILQEGEI